MLDQFYTGVYGSFSIRIQPWFVDGDHIAFLDDMDEENASILVVLDFSEASDTINHNFLSESLRGLETAGVPSFSKWAIPVSTALTCGMPEELVLSPCFFFFVPSGTKPLGDVLMISTYTSPSQAGWTDGKCCCYHFLVVGSYQSLNRRE